MEVGDGVAEATEVGGEAGHEWLDAVVELLTEAGNEALAAMAHHRRAQGRNVDDRSMGWREYYIQNSLHSTDSRHMFFCNTLVIPIHMTIRQHNIDDPHIQKKKKDDPHNNICN